MYVLYLDTGAEFSVLKLLADGKVIDTRTGQSTNDHSKYLLKLIGELLQDNKVSLQQLEAIAVMNGPGSYTGLRISLATAKGFCYANNTRLILLNKLDLLFHSLTTPEERNVVILPAREKEYFVSVYDHRGSHILKPILMNYSDLFIYLTENPPKVILESNLEEFQQLRPELLKISDHAIETLIISCLNNNLEADLMLSEPFYLKSVFINKINKL